MRVLVPMSFMRRLRHAGYGPSWRDAKEIGPAAATLSSLTSLCNRAAPRSSGRVRVWLFGSYGPYLRHVCAPDTASKLLSLIRFSATPESPGRMRHPVLMAGGSTSP